MGYTEALRLVAQRSARVSKKLDTPSTTSASPVIRKADPGIYGYGEGAPSSKANTKSVCSRKTLMSLGIKTTMKAPKRSSMKKPGDMHRSQTLSTLEGGEEYEVRLPGQRTSIRRVSSIKFDERVKVKRVASASDLLFVRFRIPWASLVLSR